MPKGLGGIELDRSGICLDVACGLGEESLWAAQQGYRVVAIDASEVAITALNSAALQPGVRDRIDSRVVDLDDGLPADVAAECSLVICQRFRDPRLYEHLVYMLQPGGVLVLTVLSAVGLDGEPGPFTHRPVTSSARFATSKSTSNEVSNSTAKRPSWPVAGNGRRSSLRA